MKATDYIVKVLIEHKVKVVFGYQGGNIAHFIDSIWRSPDIEFVSTYNEQGASFSACGYAMENQSIGVALASSGPGAINLISGIANAYYDSIPCIFITGNVSIPSMKISNEVRQNAFQENDIISMVSKITKYSVTIMDARDLRYHLEKALYLATAGRPGPVLIDLPHNIQKMDLDFDKERGFLCDNHATNTKYDYEINDIIEDFLSSHRPLFIVGGGASSNEARDLLNTLLAKWNVPVVATLRGLDIVSHKCKNYIGFGGSYGNRAANYAIKHSDVMLVLGARLDERFISVFDKTLFDKKKIYHVDVDSIELGRVLKNEVAIKSDISVFLNDLLKRNVPRMDFSQWVDTLQAWKNRYPAINEEWSINKAANIISNNASDDCLFTLDVGINQMSIAQSIVLNGQQKNYTSAGHGAMGCSIPLAIGAAYASKGKIVNCFVGDGAIHMNIQEMLLVAKNRLPIHIILCNNNCLGMIRDFQTKAFNSRFAGTVQFLSEIDYKKIAEAYGLNYYMVKKEDELTKLSALIKSEETCFIEMLFPLDVDTNPKLGKDMFCQLPLISEDDVKFMEMEALKCGDTISW